MRNQIRYMWVKLNIVQSCSFNMRGNTTSSHRSPVTTWSCQYWNINGEIDPKITVLLCQWNQIRYVWVKLNIVQSCSFKICVAIQHRHTEAPWPITITKDMAARCCKFCDLLRLHAIKIPKMLSLNQLAIFRWKLPVIWKHLLALLLFSERCLCI